MVSQIKGFDFSQLSATERILLAHELWESVENDIKDIPFTDEQMAEIKRRVKAADAGEAERFSWQELKLKLRQRQ